MHLRFVICWVLLNLGKSKQSEGESFFLRLVDGDSICSGRVELFYNETWGTICDDYWDMPDAVVVCRQIQCGFAQSARGSSQFGEGPGVIWLDDVECVGSESNLRQCKIRTVGEHNCNHVEDAGVICNPEHPPKPSIYSGKKSGVFIKGEDLKIKCSTLGFYTATMFYLYKDNGPLPLLTKSPASRHFTATFHLANITDGHSGNYSCRYDSNISGKTYSSEQSENVDIMLREYLPAPEIVYSQASNVIIEGQDITLRCQTQEKYEQCRFHLYKDDETNPIDSQMASNTQSFVLFNVTEIGQQDEGSYFCKYEVIVNKQLQFNSSFSTHLNITVQDGVKLRLSNRDSACEGELEVLYNATWGKVCGRGWHISEAEVVCRHLGCGFGKSAVSTERYGFGTDDVKLNYVHCQGTEKLLWNCRSLSWSENTCFDHFRAHVTCSEQPLKPSVTVYRMPSIYMPGENVTIQCTIAPYYIGSQMFLHKVGEKKALLSVPVPPNQKSANFTIVDVQTKQTGNYTCSYDIDISETVFKSEPSDPQAITVRDEPPEPTLSVEKDPPNYLPGQEISLQCRAPVYFTVSQYYLYKDTKNNFVRSHLVTDQDIPAVFQITAENSKEEGEYMCQYETNSTGKLYNSTLSEHIKISVAADIKLRLADGGRPCSGRIECFVNDTWATICDEEWDLAEAEVACRQLHCGFARSATRSGSFGEGSGPAWAKNIACNGTETYLWVCPYEAVYPQLCPMRNDVGVVCSDQPLQPAIYIRRPSGRFSQGENVTIDCKAPSFYQGATFFLYKTNQEAYLQSLKADDNSNTVAFLLTKISTFHEGSYTCSYQVVRDGRPSTSDISSQVKISVIDKPPKPRIDFVASLGQFSIGETALVRCIAPSAYYGVTFVLSKVENSGYITTAIVKTPGYSTILYIKDIRSKSQGDYVCMYQITRSGIVYNSTLSERKSLTVSDELQKPQATLNRPQGQYLQGQDAELTCLAPKVYSSLTFSLYKAGNPNVIASQGPISNWSVVLEIRQLEAQHQGSYSCVYQTTISGKLYTSAPSDILNITLTVEPEGAKLTLTTMFGLYVRGKSVRITCIAPEYYNTRSFRLIKDGKDTGRTWTTTQWTKQGAEFSMANITVADSGNYTCTYEAEISNKTFNSSYSNFVAIDIVERVEIRLKNGTHDCSGRVEVLSNKTWGTVCDDQWQIEDAQIVCRELACGHAITATSHAYFGQGSGPIILDDLNCQGTELFLWQCASRHWGQHNCNHHEDAGVICSGPKARLSLSPDYDVFAKGDSVTFKCSIQRHNASKRMEFLRNSVYILHEELNPEDVSATYIIGDIGENDQGYYTCRYSYLMGTQWIKSTASDPVPLILSDSPVSRRRNSAGPMNRKKIIGLSAGMIIALVLGLFALNRYRKSGYIWERKGSRLHNLQPLITNQDEQDRTEDIDEDSSI